MKDPFQEMFEELTDPLKKAESMRKASIERRQTDIKTDTGL